MKGLKVLALILSVTSCTSTKNSVELDYNSALSKADRLERSAPLAFTMGALLIYTNTLSQFDELCDESDLNGTEHDISIAAELDSDGSVKRFWLKENDKFAVCYAGIFAKKVFPKPPRSPYFVAVENTIDGS